MREQTYDESQLPPSFSAEPKTIFRGYIEDPQKPVEIIPPIKAKEAINEKLDEILSNPNFEENKKRKIQNITYDCLEKLDQNQILSGHVRGITQGLIPALVEKRECIKSFFDPNAFLKGFDHEPDGISVNDFIFQSLTRKCKPSNFSRLIYRSKQMPAIDSVKILQNRKDGITLGREVHFNALREMIHDQKNAALPIVNAIINFYETKNSSLLEEELNKWNARYPDDDISPLQEIQNYEKIFSEDKQNPNSPKVRTIDVLYRLQENLSFIGFEPPTTPDLQLNQALEKTSANFSHPSIDSLKTYEKSLIQLNEILISSIEKKQIGIDPSYIATANWLRDRQGKIIAELPFEAIETFYTENTLKEILRLMELTANSTAYNHQDFESFATKYQNARTFKEAYKLIFQRSLSRQRQTISYFKENVSSEYKFGGNLTTAELDSNDNTEKQLQSLGDLSAHKPITNKGRYRYYEALGM